MKPSYQIALLLSVPAGLMIIWRFGGLEADIKMFGLAMAPAIIVCLAAWLDQPKPENQ